MLVVRYEDVCLHLAEVLPTVLSFLNASATNTRSMAAATRAACALPTTFFGRDLPFLSPTELRRIVDGTAAVIDKYGYRDLVDHYVAVRGTDRTTISWPETAQRWRISDGPASVVCGAG